MRYRRIGKESLVLSAILMLSMSIIGFLMGPRTIPGSKMGLFLPSPDLWILTPTLSWAVDNLLLLAIGTGALFLNRHYNFIRSQDPVASAAFLFMAGSNVWVTSGLGASVLLLLANFICFSFLFDTYRKENATQEFFIVATVLSIGSMIQYAFLLMMPVFLLAGFILQAMRWREVMAYSMGLVAPYWVGLGLGLLTPTDFNMPELTSLFGHAEAKGMMGVTMLNVGLTIVTALVIGLNNTMKLFAGNSRILALNNVIALTGLAACAGIIIDFNNMAAYLATVYFTAAYQTANLYALWQIKRAPLLLGITAIIYAALFAASILI